MPFTSNNSLSSHQTSLQINKHKFRQPPVRDVDIEVLKRSNLCSTFFVELLRFTDEHPWLNYFFVSEIFSNLFISAHLVLSSYIVLMSGQYADTFEKEPCSCNRDHQQVLIFTSSTQSCCGWFGFLTWMIRSGPSSSVEIKPRKAFLGFLTALSLPSKQLKSSPMSCWQNFHENFPDFSLAVLFKQSWGFRIGQGQCRKSKDSRVFFPAAARYFAKNGF